MKQPNNNADELNTAYASWQKDQSKDSLKQLLTAAKPVISQAMRTYAPKAPPALESKAKLLLVKALPNFDPNKGVKLRSYLYTQLQPLQRELGSYNTLHIPERVYLQSKKIQEDKDRFTAENGYEPSDIDLADYTGLSVKRIRHIDRFKFNQVSDSTFESSDDKPNMSLPGTESNDIRLWETAVAHDLNPRDRTIYELKTGSNGKPAIGTSAIAKRLKISPAAVSQRLQKIDELLSEGL